jgi:hypothetical protein
MQGKIKQTPTQQSKIMLLFARYNGDRTAQCKDQRHRYAEVEYSEYTKEGVQAHLGRRVHRQSYVRCQRQVH